MPDEKLKDQAQQALDDARRLAREGYYEEALQKHIWFHHNALSIRPSFYGVRLSFALSDWIKLGKKYPKALEELRKIRDKKTQQLLAGDLRKEFFHDVAAINQRLDEMSSTVTLFKNFDILNSDFALIIYKSADSALLKAGEYDLARKYLADPGKKFSEIAKSFKECIEMISKQNEESKKVGIDTFGKTFSEEVVGLMTILKKTGSEQEARQIQTKALEILDNPLIRNFFNG